MKVVATWWRTHRRAADLFDDELEAALDMLQRQPDLGAEYASLDGEIIRRVLLKKSAQHVYYAVDGANGIILIHTIWGARRGRGPKL